MKTSIKILIITIIITSTINAQDAYRFFINKINMPINNRGVFADVNIPPDGTLGRYDGIGFLFSGGFFASGYTNDSLWANGVMTVSLVNDYQPGPVGSDADDPLNKIYVVSVGDPVFGQSWQDWSDAVDLGADFYDGNGDGVYEPVDLNNNGQWDSNEDKPDILGDLTAWCVYNDGVPDSLRRWESDPQGIEIQQTMFAYTDSHPEFGNTENTIFIRYRIINKGTVSSKLDSVLFSTFSDFDIGSYPEEDLHGSDTYLNGSYGYKDGPDGQFGNNPPAIYHHFLQTPHVYIPGETFIDNNGNGIYDPNTDTALDTAKSYKGPDIGIREIPGAKNQVHKSSIFYVGGVSVEFQEPSDVFEARNNMLGLTTPGTVVDPCTNPIMEVVGDVNCEDVNPHYWASGDPVSNQGWIHVYPWDLRTVFTVGPFDLEEEDYYDIIVAYTVGRGSDNINSISVARQNVHYSRWCYNSNFGQFPVGVKNEEQIVNDFQLYQNYPNPFNPTTTIKFSLPSPYQGEGPGVRSRMVTLKVYDILGREVTTLVNEAKQPKVYEVEFDATDLSSGIYFYKFTTGSYSSVKKMILLK